MIKKEGFPETGELVICTVKNVSSHSAFLNLEEYDGEGMLHISQVAYGRIRNIKDYVKPGKRMICRVTRVNPEKGYIDLSLKTVSQNDEKAKIKEYRRERRIDSFLQVLAKKHDLKKIEDVEKKIVREYGSLSEFARHDYEDFFKKLMLKGFEKDFTHFIESDLDKKKDVEIKVEIEAYSLEGDGVSRVKNFFKKLGATDPKLEFEYLGSSKFLFRIKSKDYKKSETRLARIKQAVEKAGAEEKVVFKIDRK